MKAGGGCLCICCLEWGIQARPVCHHWIVKDLSYQMWEWQVPIRHLSVTWASISAACQSGYFYCSSGWATYLSLPPPLSCPHLIISPHIALLISKHLLAIVHQVIMKCQIPYELSDVVMLQFGPEPKFEPKLLRTWPKSGPRFRPMHKMNLWSSLRFRQWDSFAELVRTRLNRTWMVTEQSINPCVNSHFK